MSICLNSIFDKLDIVSDPFESERQNAYSALKTFGTWPSSRSEAWRYVPLKTICETNFEKGSATESQSTATVQLLNGKLTNIGALKGVSLIPFSDLDASDTRLNLSTNYHPTNPFEPLNTCLFDEGVLIDITESQKDVITVDLISDSTSPFIVNPRIHVRLSENVKASVCIRHIYNGTVSCFENMLFRATVAKGAELRYLNLKESNENGTHFDTNHIHLEEGSQLFGSFISFGAQLARSEMEINLDAENINCTLNGLGVLDNDRQHFFKTIVHHKNPECVSNQHFKTILTETAQAEYNGLVEVYKDAQKTDSYQLNRNLVLSPKACAYSRPQLRIFADDVKCSHGSTTGEIEESEILYLMSRGLTREQSHAILIFGFAEEIIEELSVPSFHAELTDKIKVSLGQLRY